MESHEWRERSDEGIRYYRASHHAGRWSFVTTLKTDPEWYPLEGEALTPDILRALRDIVWRKYQRKRCPWARVEEIDRMLGEEPAGDQTRR